MPASATPQQGSDTAEVATPKPSGKNTHTGPGKVRQFTRHPRALARVVFLPLRPAARFTLEALLTYAEKDGRVLVSARTLAAAMPRSASGQPYAIVSVDRSMKELRAAGWVRWQVIKPGGRFPSGRRTWRGGRIWWVNVEALRGDRPPLPFDGTNSEWAITGDPHVAITGDPPSDPLVSLRETQDRARPTAGAPAPAPRASITLERERSLRSAPLPAPPPAADVPGSAPQRTSASAPGHEAPATRKGASETPRRTAATYRTPRGPGAEEREQELGTVREGRAETTAPREPPATLAQVESLIGWLLKPGQGDARPVGTRGRRDGG